MKLPARSSIAALCMASAACWGAAPARSKDSPAEGIVVTGAGEASARPDQLEIELAAAGSAELSADALIKYRDAVQKTQEAFTSLGLPNLKLESHGLGIESASNAQIQMMMRQGLAANQGMKASTEITGSLRLVLTGIDRLSEQEVTDLVGKLLDTAHDSGAAIGGGTGTAAMMARIYGQQFSQSLVTFVVANPEQARDEAYHKAFQQAKARGERLAALAGVRLGKVLALDEAPADAPMAESARQARLMAAIYGLGEMGEPADGRVTSEKFGDVPVRVSLRVRFALEPGE